MMAIFLTEQCCSRTAPFQARRSGCVLLLLFSKREGSCFLALPAYSSGPGSSRTPRAEVAAEVCILRDSWMPGLPWKREVLAPGQAPCAGGVWMLWICPQQPPPGIPPLPAPHPQLPSRRHPHALGRRHRGHPHPVSAILQGQRRGEEGCRAMAPMTLVFPLGPSGQIRGVE